MRLEAEDDSGTLQAEYDGTAPDDIRLRMAFSGAAEAEVSAAVQEVLALYTCGPAGGGGVRQRVQARVWTLSRLVPRERVPAGFCFVEGAA